MRPDPSAPYAANDPGILSGVTAVELGGRGPVPFACSLLADHGARVIRVDSVAEARKAAADHRRPVHPLRRGKDSVAVDVRTDRGRAAILRLLDHADVVVEGFRPGTAERLGLGPEVCRARNPRLIYARMGGWPTDSADARRAGHDINYISIAGALGAIGSANDGPFPPLNLVGDYATGALLSWGIATALYERERTGLGQVVQSSIYEGALYYMRRFLEMFQAQQWVDAPESNDIDGGAPWYRAYRTSDGQFVAVGAIEDKFYEELVAGLGLHLADLPRRDDRRNWPELARTFAAAFATRSRDEWCRAFGEVDACVAPVLGIEEAIEAGRAAHAIRDGYVRPAPSFPSHPRYPSGPAQRPGLQTRAVLEDLGGLTAEQLADLERDGVVFAGGSGC